ncbi:MAG: hypothetical protein ACLUE1_04485 [Adlercreutzia equolifaciens]
MFEFLSSPFGLVAVGLGVLAVAVLALCLWITTLDRRMRGMADGLETERRKVELQMVIGRRANAARSYGNRGGRQRQRQLLLRRRPSLPLRLVRPCRREGGGSDANGHPAGASAPPRNAVPASAAVPSGAAPRGRAPRPTPRPAAGGRPAASRCRRSRRWTPGCKVVRPCSNPLWCPIARCHARPAARPRRAFAIARLPN